MPPLLLDEEEAIAIAVGLRTAAQASVAGIEETSVRALVKLEQVLPAHLRRRVSALGGATATLPGGGPTVDPQCLTTIASACRDHERLRFAYRSRDGEATRRLVEPHSLVNLGRRWYLVAWDCDREDWRTFRVDRISRPAAAGGRFETRGLPGRRPTPPPTSPRTWRAPRRRYEARITVRCPAERAARAAAPVGDGRADRRSELRVPDRRRQPRLARDADRDAALGLRGPRAAGADRAPAIAAPAGGPGRALSVRRP